MAESESEVAVCPVCQTFAKLIPTRQDSRRLDCPGCGDFEITDSALASLAGMLERTPGGQAKLRHWIRKAQDGARHPVLDFNLLENLLRSLKIPAATEQVDNYIGWLGRQLAYPGQEIIVPVILATAVMGAPTPVAYAYIMEFLVDEGLVVNTTPNVLGPPQSFRGTLTIDGWRRFEELQRGSAGSRTVFMAMQYGHELLDRVYRECFEPAVVRTGLRLHRLDEHPEPGIIDNRLRVEIRRAAMMIADLTFANAGAYWEAGYAEGLERPVLYTCGARFFRREGPYAQGGGTHFDTNHCTTVLWEDSDLPKAGEQITAAIRIALPAIARMTDL